MKTKQKKGTDYHSRTGSFAAYGEGTVCWGCRKKVKREKKDIRFDDPYILFCPECKKKLYQEHYEKAKAGKLW